MRNRTLYFLTGFMLTFITLAGCTKREEHKETPKVGIQTEKVAEILFSDTSSLITDLYQEGLNCIKAQRYEFAKEYFSTIRELAKGKNENDIAIADIYLAGIENYEGNNDSALQLIRNSFRKVNKANREYALRFASEIYFDARIPDTAFIYAKELTSSKVPAHRLKAYELLLSKELIRLVPSDSLHEIIADYQSLTESEAKKDADARIQLQNNIYESQTQQYKGDNSVWKVWKNGIVFVITLISVLGGISILYKHKRLYSSKTFVQTMDSKINRTSIEPAKNDREQAERDAYREELIRKYETKDLTYEPVFDSRYPELLKELDSHILQNEPIPYDTELWDKIEAIILQESPDFPKQLRLLMGDRIKPMEFQIFLLIRLGLKPGEIAILLGRSKSAMSNRRKAICVKMFGKDLGSNFLDTIIKTIK